MPAPLLATKLYLPPPRPNVVPRPRLLARLNETLRPHAGIKLTLISAPAGFGKTTLVSAWIADFTQSITTHPITQSPNHSISHPQFAWLSPSSRESQAN